MRTIARPPSMQRVARTLPVAVIMLVLCGASGASENALHYAPNGNFDGEGNYLPGKAGFNVADVSSVSQLDALPDGVKALAWVGQCNGVDDTFVNTVESYAGNSKLFGFYLMDDPDPIGIHSTRCNASNLMAESDYIHATIPGAKTFIALMNMAYSQAPSFADTYNPANSHVDLFGIAPYPCRTAWNGCDYDIIDRYVASAESSGIPRQSIVPVFQSFGSGKWVDDAGGQYLLPTSEQAQQILARWELLVQNPVFDFAYSWGSQNDDLALEHSADLQAVFLQHNQIQQPAKP